MKKRLSSFILAFIFIVTVVNIGNAAEVEVGQSIAKSQYEMKMNMAEELKANGTIDELDKKIQQYYKDHQDKLINTVEINDVNSPEGQKNIQLINEVLMPNDIKGRNTIQSKGTNNIDFSSFTDGNIILVHDGECDYGYYRHGGTYSNSVGKFVSAQFSDNGYGNGVILEPKTWYRNNYDEAIGLTVANYEPPGVTSAMMSYLRNQLGEPYMPTAKSDRDSWYCTKLPWAGCNDYFGVDIDDNGGFMCWPDDIYNSNSVSIFVSAS